MKRFKRHYLCPTCKRVREVIEQYQLIPPAAPRCCGAKMLKIQGRAPR